MSRKYQFHFQNRQLETREYLATSDHLPGLVPQGSAVA